MDIAAPRNKAASQAATPSVKKLWLRARKVEIMTPSAKGNRIPATETVAALRNRCLIRST